MHNGYMPRPLSFFPTTRRGHGSTHPKDKVDDKTGQTVRKAMPCVNPACSLLRRQDDSGKTVRGEAHDDQYANVQDWKAERGFHKDLPIEECRGRI